MNYAQYPKATIGDIARLRRELQSSGLPPKITDRNLLVASWNLHTFGRVYPHYEENKGSPKRNLRALACIAEVIVRFDVVAVQEVLRNTTALRLLLGEFLGPDWGVILSDVSLEASTHAERLAYLYDRRRVTPSGLAGEIVLPPTPAGDPVTQFARTPYLVGFKAGGQNFTLLTVHIRYGSGPEDRLPEIKSLANYTATEIRDRAAPDDTEENNLIVLGDFNIDERGDNPLFQTFVSQGLMVPAPLRNIKTTYGTNAKYYDQIAWFQGAFNLSFSGKAGNVDITSAVYPELKPISMAARVSDHFPIWVEFITDRSEEVMAGTLGLDPAMPNPLETWIDSRSG
jgi:endonuclease/exonuclease/phosphatase family metal-dependent hydrolase